MSAFNLAKQISGPAIVVYGGATFYSKSAITASHDLETFNIEVEGLGDEADRRVQAENIQIKFTPAGEWEALSVLFPYRTVRPGVFITPVLNVTAVDDDEDTLTVTAHGLAAGTAVGLGNVGGALPTATPTLSEATVYFVSAPDANSLKLHTTAADAIAGTSAVDLTSTGTGTLRLVVQKSLTIYPLDGSNPIRFENAAVSDMPEIVASATKTLFGEVTFDCFPQHGKAWSDANSWYTDSGITPISDTSFNPANVLTLPYTVAWGNTAPWSDIKTMEGVTIKAALTLGDVADDGDGVRTRRIDSMAVSARFTPKGIGHEQLMAKMNLQGASGARGRSVGGATPDNLNISATGVYIRMYGASLLGGPAEYSAKGDRLGELNFFAKRTFATGVANPLFFVGTAAPE